MMAVSALITAQTVLISAVVVLAIVLAYLVAERRKTRVRLNHMLEGLWKMAAKELTFRFEAEDDDEIGLLERSLNRISDQIQTQQTDLREAVDYLEGIVESSADLIITVTPKGLIKTFNRGAEMTLGYDRDEVIGEHVEMLFADPSERKVAIDRLDKEDAVRNYETRLLTKDGEIRYALLTLARLRDPEGNPIGTFGISKDFTAEKELQRKLVQSEQIAAIGRSMTGIVHTIKNMLNTLQGGLYITQVGYKKGNEELFLEGCAMLQEGLSRISDLSQHMLKYTREWTLEPEPTDLEEMVIRIDAAVHKGAVDRGISFKTEIEPGIPMTTCDPRLIHMVLMDLVTNALDAVESKNEEDGGAPEVVLALSSQNAEKDRRIRLEVRDNGCGMSPEMAEHVFTPFVTTKKGGSGLGLALAARITKLHEGTIEVESEPDHGSTFRIDLPLLVSELCSEKYKGGVDG